MNKKGNIFKKRYGNKSDFHTVCIRNNEDNYTPTTFSIQSRRIV